MFAVIKEGGKQYLVKPHDVVAVEKRDADVGSAIVLENVLFFKRADGTFGLIGGKNSATVSCTVLEQKKSDKVIAFKKKRRKGYQKKIGFRKEVTVVRINAITTS